jgi:hypothetical protein
VSEACDHLPPSIVELAVQRDGWTAESWRDHLLYLAGRCGTEHPDRTAELREAAALMTCETETSNEA